MQTADSLTRLPSQDMRGLLAHTCSFNYLEQTISLDQTQREGLGADLSALNLPISRCFITTRP